MTEESARNSSSYLDVSMDLIIKEMIRRTVRMVRRDLLVIALVCSSMLRITVAFLVSSGFDIEKSRGQKGNKRSSRLVEMRLEVTDRARVRKVSRLGNLETQPRPHPRPHATNPGPFQILRVGEVLL